MADRRELYPAPPRNTLEPEILRMLTEIRDLLQLIERQLPDGRNAG